MGSRLGRAAPRGCDAVTTPVMPIAAPLATSHVFLTCDSHSDAGAISVSRLIDRGFAVDGLPPFSSIPRPSSNFGLCLRHRMSFAYRQALCPSGA